MAMDNVPTSSQSDGRWKIAYLPGTATNPLSVATLKGATSKSLTYGFTPDGFTRTINQATVSDPRLTLIQVLERPGKVTETLEVKYVESPEDQNSPDAVLVPNTDGYLVVRRGLPNETDWAAGQKVDVITFTAGAKRPDAPVENGVDTITQGLFITAPTQSQAALVA